MYKTIATVVLLILLVIVIVLAVVNEKKKNAIISATPTALVEKTPAIETNGTPFQSPLATPMSPLPTPTVSP